MHPGKPPPDGRGNPDSQRRSDLPRAPGDPHQGPWALCPPATPWAPRPPTRPSRGPRRWVSAFPLLAAAAPNGQGQGLVWSHLAGKGNTKTAPRCPDGPTSEPTGLHAQSLRRVRLCKLLDSSPPGSSVHGIFQARILEWVAISSSRGSSRPRDGTHVSCVSCMADGFFTR